MDVAWRASDGQWTYCEVKLSEGEFGAARADAHHLKKLREIYEPRLRGMFKSEWLEPHRFFKNYQIFRNISMLAGDERSRVIFLFPKENERLGEQLEAILDATDVTTKARIVIAHVEDVVRLLALDTTLTSTWRDHAKLLEGKYIVAASRSTHGQRIAE